MNHQPSGNIRWPTEISHLYVLVYPTAVPTCLILASSTIRKGVEEEMQVLTSERAYIPAGGKKTEECISPSI